MPLYPMGAIPSRPDERDYPAPRASAPGTLPPAFLHTAAQPIRDQGAEGTCVGHALAAAVLGHHQLMLPSTLRPFARTLSPRDAYEGGRALGAYPSEGVQVRDALKAAQKAGVCLEADWPYVAKQRGEANPSAADSRARNRVGTYYAVPTGSEAVKAAIRDHGPVLAVVEVRDGFNAPSGHTVWPTGASHGFHAIALVGWDDTRKAFRLANSWGTDWGDSGYAWLPYGYGLVEAWAVTPALAADPQPAPAPDPWWVSALRFVLPWLP